MKVAHPRTPEDLPAIPAAAIARLELARALAKLTTVPAEELMTQIIAPADG